MYAGSKYIVDRLGTRKGFAVFITGWSVAQALHAFTVGKWSLGACRFLLGLTEPGNWPAAAKAVGEWLPGRDRAFGVGIFNAGSSTGSALRHGWSRGSRYSSGGAQASWSRAHLGSCGLRCGCCCTTLRERIAGCVRRKCPTWMMSRLRLRAAAVPTGSA